MQKIFVLLVLVSGLLASPSTKNEISQKDVNIQKWTNSDLGGENYLFWKGYQTCLKAHDTRTCLKMAKMVLEMGKNRGNTYALWVMFLNKEF
ncbi:hypothetical protein [Helicobacter cetorum]|uniref:hypothetical protein n=1 Tax=Helicobacter cetorum TaxID=138563 RepID=UPI000CF0437D|nr:hypothetical protein [Helicobacter cetorum]